MEFSLQSYNLLAMDLKTFFDKHVENKEWILTSYRHVSNDLLNELSSMEFLALSETQDSRYGNGHCTDFSLFDQKSPEIQKLSIDLEQIIYENLSKKALSLNQDSFLNVFNSGSGTP